MSNLIFACQHWVVIHVDCIKRLIPCCKQLIELADVHGEKWSSTDFSGRLSFSLRIVRLLRSLVTESPYIEYDDSLLQQIALLADTIPSIFRQSLEFVNKQGAVESDFESLAISLVEEFLHLVQLIFCNSSVPQNIKVCIAASVLDNLDSSVWTYDKSAAIVKPPLVYFPRTIFLILGVIQDVRRAKCQNLGLKELDSNLFGSSSEFPNSPSCHLHCKEVPLLKRLTAEESLRVIFSSSAKWLDNLVHLILFLQCEGTKFRPKIEKSQSSSLKASCVVELENAVCHEDEALFGNLFSEGGRSVGSAEVYDQPQVVNSCSNNYNMPMQAASELLGFLKDVVFSQEYRTLYEDGCKMIRENHIIGMLSLLNYQEFGVEDRPLDGFSSSPDERKTWHIHELCLELLGSLLNQRALSASLEECLVDQILIVENGAFAYSDRALMLLANTLFARAGPDGSRLRTRLYEGFVAFIIDRTNNVCSECPSFRELIGTLPSVFHMEILIMAFHLSSIEEKATQANLISSTLQAIGGPSASFSSIQLSCWGLLVSRLILLLRHMLFYPDNCPSSLLLDLRSKLRDGSLSGQLSVCASEELLSWASVAAKSILGGFVEDDPSISCLINQLIDIPSLPPSVCKDDLAITSLSLSSNNLGDIFSRIMGLWKGRKASVVEDLLVERYIFLLCSDISMKCPESNSQVSIWSEFGDMDMSDTSFLFHFSHVVLGCSLDDVIDNDLQAAIFSMLKHISAMNIPQDVEELGWDFFRSSIGLSLILSLVNVGITRHANKNKVSESSAFFIKYTTHDMQYVTVAEQLVSSLISGNQIPLLVELLSSLLKIYLTAHQKAFIATLDTSHYSAEEFSPLSLLKHPDFDKCVLDEILRKCGISYCHLETAFDILLKVDSFVDKAALGNQTKALWESALHGFPFDLRTSSAVLLSCVISIRDIMTILDSLLGLGSLNQNIILDSQVHREILNSVMFIKFDRIFGSLSGICESVVRNLDPEFELSDYSDMYLLTYMEGFLRRLNESEASDSSVLEWPRKLTANDGAPVRTAGLYQSFLPFTDAADQLPETDSDLDDDVMTDTDSSVRWTVAREIQDKIPVLIEELDMESQVLQLCSSLLPSVVAKRQSELSKNKSVIVGKDKVLSFGAELLQLKKAYKSGSLDLKIKVDYSNTKDLRSHLATGSLVKSLLSVSNRGRLGVGEGDKVAIFDVGQLIGQAAVAPITADKTNVKPLSRNVVRFEIVQLSFNSVTENYLAVAGYEDCQVLTLNPRGEVIDRLSIELALQGAYIRRIDWVPGSQVKLMVVTNRFIKIYDLSQDNISPLHYFTVADDVIVDATLLMASQGIMFLVVLSEQGRLLRLQLPMEGNIGATPLKEIIQIEDRIINAKGSSLYYSCTYKLLLVSYHDGTTLMGRLSADAMRLADISFVYEEEHDGKLRPASLHRWRELLVGSGLFGCFSNTKSNSALAVYVEAHALLAQNMRHATSTTSNLVGLAAYKPLSKDKIHCLVLHDDGSLQIYVHSPGGSDNDANVAAEQVKKLGSGILNSKVYAGLKPEFPLDFFEKTVLITADVKLGGDAIRNGDSEGAKQSLGSEDGFLEGASPAGFKISVSNPNPDIVMVGIRVQVGNTSANHIPSEIGIFQRVIKLDEGMRSWYDIPFTVAESLLADEDFVISVGSTFNGTALPRIDSLEVYGRAKDEFGWKEKMDAVLGMEARVLGSKSSIAGSGKRCTSVQSTSIQEQVIADALKFLSKLYPLCQRIEDSVKMESPELKCKILLETIFESEREPLLQAAACRVLQAIYPKKERYYQVKDTMRLHGVVKSTSALLSRLGVGGTTGGWIIEEFTAQMRAVSKIALHRRSNLSNFLEINGSEVVDGLMLVLWGILDLEQPDTQTMNNIVVCAVELIYCYAECLASRCGDAGKSSVAPAVAVLKKLLFYPNEAVQSSSRYLLAISSRLLQVPFPKQTMLSTDDSVDSSVSASGPGDTSGSVNTQVMVEEDTITSSVQYCCDGCSTVPILRRRWHCTVCPDFDLCEACYQVLDVDRLPPPHSRDHPMTAIPIELESLGGDGSEIHFSAEDVNDSNLLRATSDIVLQNSAPSIHVLEPNESGEFSVAMTDSVSISASKRAVNSLLLSELLEQLSGWMHTTSGVRTIPIMQLFYRLSSAVGGPFIDGSQPDTLDLEKLIMWFLDETNLNQPFPAKTRSSFGEVAILVFMFFTLMLRNWHQPGTDGSAKSTATAEKHDKNVQATSVALQSTLDSPDKNSFASQLLRACSSLRNQAFVNYLMDILQQLMQVFKSSSGNAEASISNNGSGCGSLLTVRRDLPAGNFSPFFSDSYAKAHYSDIFMDYHRLLLENAFRLVYTLVRPEKQEKGDKEKVYKASSGKDLKLDGYQDVLCSYINNPNTTFVRRYARRLFLHICGSKTQYYSIRDSWQFSSEVKKLYKHINKSGSLQNPVPYERSVKIVKCLSTMAEVAAARPRNWQKYCLRQGDVLPFFMGAVFYFSEESVVQTLRLINLAFYCGKEIGHSQKVEGGDTGTSSNKSGSQIGDSKKKKKGEDGIDTSSEKSYLDMEAAVDIFNDKDGDVLRQFIDCFLLEWNLSSVRAEAKCVLYGAWHHGKHSFKEMMLLALLQKVRNLPVYGQNIIEFTELVTWLLGKTPDIGSKQSTELLDRCLTNEVIIGIFDILHSQNELIANHPNSRIYNTLSGLVEFDGYYLESEPCVACSSPEVPYSRMKLESLKSETKFTDNRIIVKCTGSYTIQSVTMNVHDARKSKSVKVLNLYYNNRPVADLSELKNNWSSWKRAKSCHLAFNQTELKVEFPIPITACNFMIELDSFYENLQALSLEPLQCPRCSRPVTDKHGICSNCHENAYQCRQCRNINYENLDSFLCNECGYSKYGRFEFNFMAKPSFTFDDMENDEDMKRGLTAIESESENAHRRYQQLLGFKKPLLKIVSSIGENEMDSQQKDSVQQMMVSLPGPSCKVNRKIALLGVLYGEKCKAAFDSVSKSVQTLQGLRRVLMSYLHQKHSDDLVPASRFVASRSPNSCYGCATTFITQCLEILQVLSKHSNSKKQLVSAGILSELFENNIHQGPKTAHVQARSVLCAFSEGDVSAVIELNSLIQKKVMYCLEHHRSMDIAVATREEMILLSEVCSLTDEFWESRLRIVFQLLFSSIKLGAKHPAIAEHIILPCLRIISQACTPPKPDKTDKEQDIAKSASASRLKEDNNLKTSGSLSGITSASKSVTELPEKKWSASNKTQDIQLLSYSEWEKGASYLDFVRRQYKASQAVKSHKLRPQRHEYLALKYMLRWKRRASKTVKGDLSIFELGSWVTELVLSACSQSIRSEMCMLISLLCAQSSSRQFRLLNLLVALLPATLAAGESATEYFELLFKMTDSEDARLFLTVRGCLSTICKLIAQEVGNVHPLEKSLHVDISQGFILHKLIELLGKFLEVPNIRSRFMRDNLLPDILEALIVIRGLVVQKTKLISDCNRLLKDLLDGLLLESSENKRQFIRACISGLQIHAKERKPRTCLFILEQLCNLICPSKQDSVYLLVLNKAHTQEEFIRGSMTKNPYSSAEIGPLMRDVKNKICQQLDLLGLLEDDYGMELLVAGNIISLDLSIAQVYEQVWKKSNSQSSNSMANNNLLSSSTAASARESPPMTVTYRLQGLDGEATEPMIKELEEDREESQDPEVEFAIAGAVRECGGLEILLGMIQRLREDLKSNHEQLVAVLNLLMHCCRIRENRHALLKLGALGLLLETARRAFSMDAMEPAEGILLIVESLTLEANESDNISITQSTLTVSSEETGTGGEAKKIVLMFLERLCHPLGLKKSNKQQRNTEMVARILPYLTYGEAAAMEALVEHFNPYLQDWKEFDVLQKQHEDNPEDNIGEKAAKQRFAVENFVRVSESLKTSSCGERLKDIIIEKGITDTAVRHLRESFAIAGQTGFKSTAEWSLGLKLPSVPLILSMLRGLSMGHFATQRCIDEGGVLPLLHALEGVSGENEIGARAENLLDTLSNKEGKGDGCLEEKVNELRRATRDEMRRRALRKRHELLQGLGMRQELSSDGGERIVVARPNLEGLEDVEEEADGLACMVCREGYSLRPSDLLGVYTFSKRVNLGAGTTGSARGECVYTTVSYFNIIHFQCHQEAKRADAALKNPKKEWEGATLRNNESLCNSLFPIRGPMVPLAQYTRYVDQFWDNLNALGRADGSRLRLLTYDIVLMLARFATGASFSAESRGGGRESNSRFLPFMIQMARYLFEQGSPSQRRNMAKSISSYIDSPPSESKSSVLVAQPAMGTEETVQFMMVNSLLSESYKSWLQHRRAFLQRGIYHAYMQHTHGRSSTAARVSTASAGTARQEAGSSSSSSSRSPTTETDGRDELLSIIRPMLVYTGLIEQLQQFLKVKKGSSAQLSQREGSTGENEMEDWELVMKERLLKVREMVGFSKELVSWLEEMNSASDLQEAFDIIGVLPDVLSGGTVCCEDFVNAAIDAGKS
ncbi:Auxin transport protein BIG [Linum perenne]